MYRLAIIGAGQLGSRYLQGLAHFEFPCEIDVVDPSRSSLDIARQRFEEIPKNSLIQEVRYHTSVKALPQILDLVIVATNSDVRFDVLKELLGQSKVGFLLLEKVLFQRANEYEQARNLLTIHQVKAWVNCTRRAFPIYSDIRDFFADDPLRHMQVRGGDWGLGCNGIHFLDIFGMLTNSPIESISTEGLDTELISSKRKGFFEFTGTLSGVYASGASFEITSLVESHARILIMLRSEARTCLVDEAGSVAFFMDVNNGGTWEKSEFKIPRLSDLSHILVAQILTKQTSELPTYEESAKYHLPFIYSLAQHGAKYHALSTDLCPIT